MRFFHWITQLFFRKPPGFTVKGEHGSLSAWPDGKHSYATSEQTYWVDVVYYGSDTHSRIHQRKNGFRLATVCCICACVCFGEKTVDSQLISRLNSWFYSPE